MYVLWPGHFGTLDFNRNNQEISKTIGCGDLLVVLLCSAGNCDSGSVFGFVLASVVAELWRIELTEFIEFF